MKYIIFGSKNCIWCNKSVDLLKAYKLKYKYYEVSNIKSNNKLYNIVPTNYKTIPKIIVVNNNSKPKFIGGFNELLTHINKHALSSKKSKSKKSKSKKPKSKKSKSKKSKSKKQNAWYFF